MLIDSLKDVLYSTFIDDAKISCQLVKYLIAKQCSEFDVYGIRTLEFVLLIINVKLYIYCYF